ncbi:hypothetical protein ZWY2020_010370, partial [Hordeum vulgare]
MCSDLQLARCIHRLNALHPRRALHFMLTHDSDDSVEILKYDLSSNCLSLIDTPLSGAIISGSTILMAMGDGSLGFAHVDKLTLHLWSRQRDLGGWIHGGDDIIFITADLGIYEVNMKTLQWKKLWKRE